MLPLHAYDMGVAEHDNWNTIHVSSKQQSRIFSRISRFFALCLAVTIPLAACTVRLDTPIPPLPTLTGIDQIRDHSARTDAAIAAVAGSISVNPQSCQSCIAPGDEVFASARSRLESVGGIWRPWDESAPEDAPQPQSVTPAPTEVKAFVQWMAQRSFEELHALASMNYAALDAPQSDSEAPPSDDNSAQSAGMQESAASALALISTQRLVQALSMARTQGIELSIPDNTDVPQSAGNASDAHATQAASVATVWDCLAQKLSDRRVSGENFSTARASVNDLFNRSQLLVAYGIPDTREYRCTSTVVDLSTVVTQLIHADLQLMGSASHQVRQIALNAILTDLDLWAKITPDLDARLLELMK